MRITRLAAAAMILMLFSAAPCALAAEPSAARKPARTAVATFAMGCFWCAETAFEGQPGVLTAVSGYTGGREPNPTYDQVANHRTSHYEALQVTYDPDRTTYAALLELFWTNIDPTQADGQFCDRGEQYRSAVFVHDAAQRRAALDSRAAIETSGVLKKPIVTAILPAARFWPAEDYHQDFWRKSPGRYTSYRQGCGRDARLHKLWGARAGKSRAH